MKRQPMVLLGYEAWVDMLSKADHPIKCVACGGEGSRLEDCDCCGNETIVDCDLCDTEGEFVPAEKDWTPMKWKTVFTLDAYRKAILVDAAAVYRWTGVMPLVPDLQNIAPVQDISTRQISVRTV